MSVATLRNTQSEITHEVIESVVHLTEQRDELTLLRSLQNSIHEMLPQAQIAMACLIANDQGAWVNDTACTLPTPMFAISAGLEAEVVALDSECSIREYG